LCRVDRAAASARHVVEAIQRRVKEAFERGGSTAWARQLREAMQDNVDRDADRGTRQGQWRAV
jgi:hypothetical protein